MTTDKLTLTLTLAQVNVVLTGLGKLPMEQSLETWMEVRRQAEPQVDQPSPAVQTEAQGPA